MSPGTGVEVVSGCSLNGRTGIVAEVSPWADLGWLRVSLDPVAGKASWGILPAKELREVARAGQLGLFGGAS